MRLHITKQDAESLGQCTINVINFEWNPRRTDKSKRKCKYLVLWFFFVFSCSCRGLFSVLRLRFAAERSSSSCSCHYSMRPHLGYPSRHPNTFSLTLPRKKIWTILTNSYRRFPSVFEHVDDQDNKL